VKDYSFELPLKKEKKRKKKRRAEKQ